MTNSSIAGKLIVKSIVSLSQEKENEETFHFFQHVFQVHEVKFFNLHIFYFTLLVFKTTGNQFLYGVLRFNVFNQKKNN